MKKNMFSDAFAGCLGWSVVAILLIVIGPALGYVCGWINGHLLSWVIGDTLVNGLNYLFNTTRFTVDKLPMLCGTLGVIGSFFKSTHTSSSSN